MNRPAALHIAHLSDPHFGTVVPAVRDALLEDLRTQPTDLVLLTGDITQRARRAQFREARRFLEALTPVPWLALPGNHDLPLFDLIRRVLDPYGRYRTHISQALQPEYIDDRLAVLCVDATSPRRHKDGVLTDAQIDRIAQRLAGLDRPFRLVATHQPLAAVTESDLPNVTRGAARALDRWIDAGADLFLGGHIHLPYCIAVRSTDSQQTSVLLQAGTCLSHRVRNGMPNSYNLLTLQQHAAQRVMFIERRDYDAASGRFLTALQYEARNDMDAAAARPSGWQLVPLPRA